MQLDTLIINGRILARPGSGAMIAQGFVAICGQKIVAIGDMAEAPIGEALQVIDAGGNLVMPGLVNGHGHSAMSLFRGLADDLPLLEWLENHIFPAEAKFVNSEMVYWATKLSCAEMLLGGTTTVADGYFLMAAGVKAYEEAGMRALACQGVIDFPVPGVPESSQKINVLREFIDDHGGQDLIRPAIFAHSPYTCSPQTLQDSRELAREKGVPFFIHLAETKGEKKMINAPGHSPVSYLDSLGVLDEGVVLVHAIWLEADDIALVAKRGCRVVSCPSSNMHLASGVAPVAQYLEAGVLVGLGTDGVASNNDLDMFAEMDLCAKLAKVNSLQASALPAQKVLTMATKVGAQCLGFNDLGWLAPGYRADLLIVNLQQPHLTPFYGEDLLVYAGRAADVLTVFIDGKIVVRDRKLLTMDVTEIMRKIRKLALEVMGKADDNN